MVQSNITLGRNTKRNRRSRRLTEKVLDREGLGDIFKQCLWALVGKAFNASSVYT